MKIYLYNEQISKESMAIKKVVFPDTWQLVKKLQLFPNIKKHYENNYFMTW